MIFYTLAAIKEKREQWRKRREESLIEALKEALEAVRNRSEGETPEQAIERLLAAQQNGVSSK